MSPSNTGWALSRELVHKRDLLRELVVRDMKLRYKRSYLGILWTLVNPITQLLVFNFVFTVLFRTQTPHFVTYLFIGITSWNWFSVALLESTGTILGNKAMISQPGFPAALLPNVAVGANLVHFLLTLPILFALVVVDGIPLTFSVLWLPVVIAVQYLFVFSLALLGASLHVNFRDTQYLLGLFLMLGFFMTPILYDLSIVPAQYRPLYVFNPMTHIIDAYRAVLMRGEAPHFSSLFIVALLSLVQLGVFYRFFKWASTSFAEEL